LLLFYSQKILAEVDLAGQREQRSDTKARRRGPIRDRRPSRARDWGQLATAAEPIQGRGDRGAGGQLLASLGTSEVHGPWPSSGRRRRAKSRAPGPARGDGGEQSLARGDGGEQSLARGGGGERSLVSGAWGRAEPGAIGEAGSLATGARIDLDPEMSIQTNRMDDGDDGRARQRRTRRTAAAITGTGEGGRGDLATAVTRTVKPALIPCY
jgi:hypothetical protein